MTTSAKITEDFPNPVLVSVPLKNGTNCKVSQYYEPQESDDGEVKCGVDVARDDGSLLRFTITQNDWGKLFADTIANKVPKLRRGR
jgi:hypothetical protein